MQLFAGVGQRDAPLRRGPARSPTSFPSRRCGRASTTWRRLARSMGGADRRDAADVPLSDRVVVAGGCGTTSTGIGDSRRTSSATDDVSSRVSHPRSCVPTTMTSADVRDGDIDDRAGGVTDDPECGCVGEPTLFAGLLGDRLGDVDVGDHVIRSRSSVRRSSRPSWDWTDRRPGHRRDESRSRRGRSATGTYVPPPTLSDEVVGVVAEQAVRGLDGMDRGRRSRRRRSAQWSCRRSSHVTAARNAARPAMEPGHSAPGAPLRFGHAHRSPHLPDRPDDPDRPARTRDGGPRVRVAVGHRAHPHPDQPAHAVARRDRAARRVPAHARPVRRAWPPRRR